MGCGTSTIKFLLFIFNFIFAVGGLALLVIGSIIQWNVNNYGELFDGKVAVPAILLITVGSLTFVIAFFGCCGAIQESHCMIVTYSVVVLIILIAQVVGGILALVYRDQIDEFLVKELKTLQQNYQKPGPAGELATETWDSLQVSLKCCGVDGPQDWVLITGTPPQSCSCQSSSENCFSSIYTDGCAAKFSHLLHSLETVIGVIAIVIAVIELVTIIFACTLAASFKRKQFYKQI